MYKVRAAVAVSMLAVGGLGSAGIGVASAADGSSTCSSWARTHTFVQVDRAYGNPRAGLTVTGHRVTVHCGGPDDLQYITTKKAFTGHLLPAAKITVIALGNGIQVVKLPEYKLPRWIVKGDHGTRVFSVTGPAKAIRGLDEEYHP